MPGIPGTRLTITHSKVTLALLKALLNPSILVFKDVKLEIVVVLPVFVFHHTACGK